MKFAHADNCLSTATKQVAASSGPGKQVLVVEAAGLLGHGFVHPNRMVDWVSLILNIWDLRSGAAGLGS